MEMPEPVRKYWPYALGGVVGLVLILKLRGSGSSTAVDPTAAYLAQQNAAGLQYANAQLAATGQAAQIAAQQDATDKAFAIQTAQIAAVSAANNNSAQAAFVSSQASMAQAIGSAASGVIQALNQPAIMAINSATTENQAALAAAASAANTGFLASASAIKSVAGVSANLASAVNAQAAAQTAQQAQIQQTTRTNTAAGASNDQMYAQLAAGVALALL
jgi:hypothetical protein